MITYGDGFAVSPSNTADLAQVADALWVETAGDVRVLTDAGEDVTYTAVPHGLANIRARRVFLTGTAAGLIALTKPKEMPPLPSAVAITPNDTAELAPLVESLHIGGAGKVPVDFESGAQAIFTTAAAGEFIPIRVTKVRTDASQATGIVGMRQKIH